MKSHVVPEVNVHVPETQASGEAALISIMAAVHVESDLEQGTAENTSVPSQELPVNEHASVTHEEADEIPELDVPISVETEPEPLSTTTTSTSGDKTLDVEERHVLSPENREAANMELKDVIIPLTAAEPGPEVVAPVLGTFELQAQESVEETTEVSFSHNRSAGSLVNCKKNLKGGPYRSCQ